MAGKFLKAIKETIEEISDYHFETSLIEVLNSAEFFLQDRQ